MKERAIHEHEAQTNKLPYMKNWKASQCNAGFDVHSYDVSLFDVGVHFSWFFRPEMRDTTRSRWSRHMYFGCCCQQRTESSLGRVAVPYVCLN